jgi:hypothetical protein
MESNPLKKGKVLIQADVKMYPLCCNGSCLKSNAIKVFIEMMGLGNEASSEETLRHNAISKRKVFFVSST